MAIYLSDSDILIDSLKRQRGRDRLLSSLIAQGHTIAYCDISMMEVYVGLRDADLPKADRLFSELTYYEITPAIAREAALLRRSYGRKGISLSLTDTAIAAVALHHNLTLITGNRKDFPMPDIRLYPLP